MAQHTRPRRRLDRSTLVAAALSAALAGLIGWSFATADTPVTDCYSNPDVRGTYC